MNQDIETTLRAQCWRDPPPEFFERILGRALQNVAVPNRKSRALAWLSSIPRPLRLPLAACWLLAFFFRITTPEAVPQSTLKSYVKLPPMTPAQMLTNRLKIEQLADELLHPQHHGVIPPL